MLLVPLTLLRVALRLPLAVAHQIVRIPVQLMLLLGLLRHGERQATHLIALRMVLEVLRRPLQRLGMRLRRQIVIPAVQSPRAVAP